MLQSFHMANNMLCAAGYQKSEGMRNKQPKMHELMRKLTTELEAESRHDQVLYAPTWHDISIMPDLTHALLFIRHMLGKDPVYRSWTSSFTAGCKKSLDHVWAMFV